MTIKSIEMQQQQTSYYGTLALARLIHMQTALQKLGCKGGMQRERKVEGVALHAEALSPYTPKEETVKG